MYKRIRSFVVCAAVAACVAVGWQTPSFTQSPIAWPIQAPPGGAIRTDNRASATWLLQAWNSTSSVFTNVGVITGGTDPSIAIPASIGLTVGDGAPGTTTNKLYNVGGTIYFNGSPITADLTWPITAPTGGKLTAGATAGNTFCIAAWDTDTGPTDTCLLTATSGTTPGMTAGATLSFSTLLDVNVAMATPAVPTITPSTLPGSDLADGVYTIGMTAIDPAGNQSAGSQTATCTINYATNQGRCSIAYVLVPGATSYRFWTSAAGGTTPDRYFVWYSAVGGSPYVLQTLSGATVATYPSTNAAYALNLDAASASWFPSKVLVGPGSSTDPSYSFVEKTDSGLWFNVAVGYMIFTVGGADALHLNTTNAVFQGPNIYAGQTTPGLSLLSSEAAAVWQLGADVNGSTVAYTLKSGDGITGTDIAGANLTLAGGRGTGAGAPGTLIFQTSTALGTGTTAQTLATRLIIGPTGAATFGTTAGTGTGAVYADTYYTGTTVGCTGTPTVTTKGIATTCVEPVPDPLTAAEVAELRGLLSANRTK